MLTNILAKLVEKQHLDGDAMRIAVRAILKGECQEAEVAAFLMGLRMKGETAGEIATAVMVLREHMVRLEVGERDVLDTCGTGGDGKGTFNISTAAALVAAACGVRVVKHGNRSVSSVSGSADVLAALGVRTDPDLETTRRCLEEVGFAFCFAPRFHPAMKHVAGVRQRLGFRTIFNLMGPLLNPAGARYQLIGVGRMELLDTMAECVALLGAANAYLVCGHDGLDEVSLTGPTAVRHVQGGVVRSLEWTPADFGLPPCRLADLQIGTVQESAQRIRSILQGDAGPATDVVVANAAAALLAAQRVHSLADGVQQARRALGQEQTHQLLERLIAVSSE